MIEEKRISEGIRLIAVGDVLAARRICRAAPSFPELRRLLLEADVRLMNLEGTIHSPADRLPASGISGGDWVASSPQVLQDLEWLGFNAVSAANNHSMDWLHAGLMKTAEHLERGGMVYAGIGENLFESARPRYLETPGGRVALIALTTTCQPWHSAGQQRRDCPGRPGVHMLRHERIHRVTEEQMATLRCVAESTDINQKTRQREDGFFRLGDLLFQVGEPGTYSRLNEDDACRLEQIIKEASRMADLVVISCHSHEYRSRSIHENTDFQTALAHRCIDSGAHVYVGHGPHVLRGVEFYRGRPIFYSLGDFFYQCEQLDRAPQEFYDAFGKLGAEACTADGYAYRMEAGGMFGVSNPNCYRSVMADFQFSGGGVKEIRLIPVSLRFSLRGSDKGTPCLASGDEAVKILEQIRELSFFWGTQIDIKDGYGTIHIPNEKE